MSCWETIADYGLRSIGIGERLLPRDNFTLCPASENNGSCKIFAFAKLNGLSKQNTLDCFGKFYREDVLNNPNADDHMNIRTFMLAPEATPFLGISFDGTPLTTKK